MTCENFREKITNYIEKVLEGDALQEFRYHRATCPDCKSELAAIERAIDACRTTEPFPLPPDFDKALRKKLKNRLEISGNSRKTFRFSRFGTVCASMAALIIIGVTLGTNGHLMRQKNSSLENYAASDSAASVSEYDKSFQLDTDMINSRAGSVGIIEGTMLAENPADTLTGGIEEGAMKAPTKSVGEIHLESSPFPLPENSRDYFGKILRSKLGPEWFVQEP